MHCQDLLFAPHHKDGVSHSVQSITQQQLDFLRFPSKLREQFLSAFEFPI